MPTKKRVLNTKLPVISIIVLNWNGKKFVDQFMKSYLDLSYPREKLELLFTDNDSSDDSVAYFNEKYGNNREVRVVANKGNYGYAKGNNQGLKQAKGDFILVVNNDVYMDKDVLQNLLGCLQDNNADSVVPKLLFLNKKGYVNNAGSELKPDNKWPVAEIGINEKDDGRFDKDKEITAFCGACVLFKRSFLEEVGLFDGRFFMYFEDVDLSWRGQKAGKKYYYASKALAHHEHTGTSKEGSPLFNHYVSRNLLVTLAKNARFGVFLSAFGNSFRIHFLMRSKNIMRSFIGNYGKRQALVEFYLSQKILWDFARLFPYALLKRWGLMKEEKL